MRPGRTEKAGFAAKRSGKQQSEGWRGGGLQDRTLPGRAWPTPRAVPFSAPPPGIVFSNRRRWLTLRNFALGALEEFRLGARTVEERILEEADCLLGEFQATIGAAWSGKERDLLWM